jgi:NDP-sugar pyrophosphorylase family protein
MADRLDENFLVMNGDLLTTLNYQRAFAHHLSTGAAATVCVFRRDSKIDFGVIEIDGSGNLAKYTEKPTFDFTVSMGINFFHRRVLDQLHDGERLDIPELIAKLMAAGERVACYSEECRWLDIGRADDYLTATETFAQFQDEFLPSDG